MQKKFSKHLAVLLAILMVVSILPFSVFADQAATEQPAAEQPVEEEPGEEPPAEEPPAEEGVEPSEEEKPPVEEESSPAEEETPPQEEDNQPAETFTITAKLYGDDDTAGEAVLSEIIEADKELSAEFTAKMQEIELAVEAGEDFPEDGEVKWYAIFAGEEKAWDKLELPEAPEVDSVVALFPRVLSAGEESDEEELLPPPEEEVEAQENISLSGIFLNPYGIQLPVGDRESFKLTLVPANASIEKIEWGSNDAAIASVTPAEDGMSATVTGVATGDATITAKVTDKDGNEKLEAASVEVVEVEFTLLYHSNYPDGAKKMVYINGDGKSSIVDAKNTIASYRYAPNTIQQLVGGYSLTNAPFLGWAYDKDAAAPEFAPGDEIEMNSNKALYAIWGDINNNNITTGNIDVTYKKTTSSISTKVTINTPATIKVVGQSGSGSSRRYDYEVTFVLANAQETEAVGFDGTRYGWTVQGKTYSFNDTCTVTFTNQKNSNGLKVDAIKATKSGKVFSQFFVLKGPEYKEGETKSYHSVGVGEIKLPASFDYWASGSKGNYDGDLAAQGYILSAPDARLMADRLEASLDEVASIRWYVIKKGGDHYHVDGIMGEAGTYYKVNFWDGEELVETKVVKRSGTVSNAVFDAVEAKLNNTGKGKFLYWTDGNGGSAIDQIKFVGRDYNIYSKRDKMWNVTGSFAEAGAGTAVPANQQVANNSYATPIKFTAAEGYEITGYTVNGVPQTVTNDMKAGFTYNGHSSGGKKVTSDVSVVVSTKAKNYTVSGSIDNGGTVTPSDPQTVKHGEYADAITFEPATGYEITGVLVNGEAQTVTEEMKDGFTFDTYSANNTPVTSDITVKVTTKPKVMNVMVTTQSNNKVYGNADPDFEVKVTSPDGTADDTLLAAIKAYLEAKGEKRLTRVAGENVVPEALYTISVADETTLKSKFSKATITCVNTGVLTIEAVKITLTADTGGSLTFTGIDQTWPANGLGYSTAIENRDSMPTGEAITGLTASGTGSEITTHDVVFIDSGAKVGGVDVDIAGNKLTGNTNYDITLETGTFEIKAPTAGIQWSITGKNVTKGYTGAMQNNIKDGAWPYEINLTGSGFARSDFEIVWNSGDVVDTFTHPAGSIVERRNVFEKEDGTGAQSTSQTMTAAALKGTYTITYVRGDVRIDATDWFAPPTVENKTLSITAADLAINIEVPGAWNANDWQALRYTGPRYVTFMPGDTADNGALTSPATVYIAEGAGAGSAWTSGAQPPFALKPAATYRVWVDGAKAAYGNYNITYSHTSGKTEATITTGKEAGVIYNANDKTLSEGKKVPVDGNSYAIGDRATVSTDKSGMVSEGWTFKGWSVDKNAKTPDDFEGGMTTVFTADEVASNGKTLYAVWQADFSGYIKGVFGNYQTTYNGTNMTTNMTDEVPHSITVNKSVLRDDDTVEFSEEKDGTYNPDNPAYINVVRGEEDKLGSYTVYARVARKNGTNIDYSEAYPYTVTIKPVELKIAPDDIEINRGIAPAYKVTGTPGTIYEQELGKPDVVLSGIDAAGVVQDVAEPYNTNAYDGAQQNASGTYPLKFANAQMTGAYAKNYTFTPGTATLTVNPSWQVVYNANGGSGGPGTTDTKYYKSGESGNVLFDPAPTRANYVFKGWATSATGQLVYTNPGPATFNMPNLADANGNNDAATYELFAVWALDSSVFEVSTIDKVYNGAESEIMVTGPTGLTFTTAFTDNQATPNTTGKYTNVVDAKVTVTITVGGESITLPTTARITKRPVTINSNGARREYNGEDQTVNAAAYSDASTGEDTGLVDGHTVTAGASGTGRDVDVDGYDMTWGNVVIKDKGDNDVSGNYNITKGDAGKLEIYKAKLTLTLNAEPARTPLGSGVVPTFSVTPAGLKGKDTLRGALGLGDEYAFGATGVYNNNVPADYPMVHSRKDYEARNYAIEYVDTSVVVYDEEGLIITLDPEAFPVVGEYNGLPYSLDLSKVTVTSAATRLKVEDATLTVYKGSDVVTDTSRINVGKDEYTIKATREGYADSEAASATASVEVKPFTVTATAINNEKFVDENDPPLTYELNRKLPSDAKDHPTFTPVRDKGEDIKSYDINIADTSNDNYDVTPVKGTFTIKPLTGLSVAMQNLTVDYNATGYTLAPAVVSVNKDGAKVGDMPEGTTVKYALAEDGPFELDAPPENTNVGSYPLYVQISNPKYAGKPVTSATLTINKAKASINVHNKSKSTTGRMPKLTGDVPTLFGADTISVTYRLADAKATTNRAGKYGLTADWTPDNEMIEKNYEITVKDGTLTVTAPGTTTTPTTPTTPSDPGTPVVPGPAAPAGPGAPGGPGAPVVPETTPPTTLDDTTPPLANPDEPQTFPAEVLGEEEAPLANLGAWALLNLIIAVLAFVFAILLVITAFKRNKQQEETEEEKQARMAAQAARGEEPEEAERNKKSGFGWRVLSVIAGIAAPIVFFLTENIRLPMVFTDRWTLAMVIILVVQVIGMLLMKRARNQENDDEQAQNA